AGGISEPAVRGVTNPGARGAEPFDIMFDRGIGHRPADAALGTDAALRIGPVEIGFGPQDQRAGLPVVADLSAASRAKHGGVYGRERHAADAESTSVAREVDADIPTDIKTTPIGYGTIRRRRRVDRRTWWCWRQGGRAGAKRRERNDCHECCDEPAHGDAPRFAVKARSKYRTPKRLITR